MTTKRSDWDSNCVSTTSQLVKGLKQRIGQSFPVGSNVARMSPVVVKAQAYAFPKDDCLMLVASGSIVLT